MTAAERQQRRRAKLKEKNSSRPVGRPRHSWLDTDRAGLTMEDRYEIMEEIGTKRESVRRSDAARVFEHWGKQVLKIDINEPDYSRENAKLFAPIIRKHGILEQIGRHAWMTRDADDTLELAKELIKQDRLNVKDVVNFFCGLENLSKITKTGTTFS
jgi:hypothetical protein